MSGPNAGTQVTGIVNTDVNVRLGPQVTDPKWPSSPLKTGTQVIITGFSIDPNGEGFKQRYQILINGATLWTTAKFVTVDPALIGQIPFVPTGAVDAASALLESLGIDIAPGAVIPLADAQALAALLRDFDMKGTWGAEEVHNALQMIEHLRSYGVTPGSQVPGRWSLAELSTLVQAVDGVANGTASLFQTIFGVADPALAFRVMYAPIHIVRAPIGNVNPNPSSDAVWYARNTFGYEITFGNFVFFNGAQGTKSYPHLPFTSQELIAHEISHVINYRYKLKLDNGTPVLPQDYYATLTQAHSYTLSTGEVVPLPTLNDGYLFVARSSDDPYETVTDAIANWSLGRLAINDPSPQKQAQGLARQAQVADLMRRVIVLHIQSYAGRAGMTQDIVNQGGQALLTRLTPALDLLFVGQNNLDQQVAQLKS